MHEIWTIYVMIFFPTFEMYTNKTYDEPYVQSYIATQRAECNNVMCNMCEHVEGLL